MKWTVGQPGGPNGPFYSIVTEKGGIVALQIPDKETAELIAKFGPILGQEFDAVHAAGRKLREIIDREGAGSAVEVGSEDYVIRAAIVALLDNGKG